MYTRELTVPSCSQNKMFGQNTTLLYTALTVLLFEEVEDRQELAVVRDESLADVVRALHQLLQRLQRAAHHRVLPGVQRLCTQFNTRSN